MDTVPYYLLLFGLGCLHALEPGHGKSLVAAYLLGQNAKATQAVLLGGTVALLHALGAIGLIALGTLLLNQSQALLSQWSTALQTYGPVVSGLIISSLGIWLLIQALLIKDPNKQHCDHPEQQPKGFSFTQVVLLGAVTGLAPCSVSVVALLAALQLGDSGSFWPKVPALLSFSAGLGTVITAIGLLAISTKDHFSSWFGKQLTPWHSKLHKLTALFILGLGLWITAQAFLGNTRHEGLPVWL